MKKSKCYFNRLIDLRNEAISKVKEILADKEADLTDAGIPVIIESSSGGCYAEYLESISNIGFKTRDGSYTLDDMYIEDLCYILDYLIENQVTN